jgi:SLOG cluster2
MNDLQRPLAGYIVGLSISESEDSTVRGFPPWQVNRVTLQVVSALFGQGAGVIFGHDWREDGVMEAVHSFARQMQPPLPFSANEPRVPGQPLLQNLLPWPDKPRLSQQNLDRLRLTLRVEPAGLSEELISHQDAALAAGPTSRLYRYIRARGLTHMRHRLNAECGARLCLGGKTSGSAGRFPGVIEEAFLAVKTGKPLYLAGLLGGASRQVIDAIEGKEMPDVFCRTTSISELYERPPVVEREQDTQLDRTIDRMAIWTTFKNAGVRSLAERNRLTIDETKELFHTLVLDRVIELLLTSLAHLRNS